MRTLVVEDDPKLGPLLQRGLSERGGAADLAATGEDALWMAKARSYDAIILDVMLPGLDGFATCARLRAQGVWTPVLLLTARDAVDDRSPRARLRRGRLPDQAVLDRRAARTPPRHPEARCPERPVVLQVGDLKLDPATQRVWRGNVEIQPSTKELALLDLFMHRPG